MYFHFGRTVRLYFCQTVVGFAEAAYSFLAAPVMAVPGQNNRAAHRYTDLHRSVSDVIVNNNLSASSCLSLDNVFVVRRCDIVLIFACMGGTHR